MLFGVETVEAAGAGRIGVEPVGGAGKAGFSVETAGV